MKTVQTLCKIASVITMIGKIAAMVGLVAMTLGAGALGFVGVLGVDITGLSPDKSWVVLLGELVRELPLVVATLLVCIRARTYFEHELAVGTPFTVDGALEFRKLGIYALVVDVVMSLLSTLIALCFGLGGGQTEVGIGGAVTIILVSYLLSAGAESLDTKDHLA